MKSEFKKAGTLQLTGIRRIAGELLCVRDAGADAGGRWIFVVDDFFSLHILLVLQFLNFNRLVTHTAVSSPKCNSENRPLSNSVALRTLFKWHWYCGI